MNKIINAYRNGVKDKYPTFLRSDIPTTAKVSADAKAVRITIELADGRRVTADCGINFKSGNAYRMYANGAGDRTKRWDRRWGLPTYPKSSRGGTIAMRLVGASEIKR